MSRPAIECEARLRMRLENSSIADLVMRALQPDNQPLPEGLELSMRREDSELVFEIRSRRPIASLLATLDDIVASAILALKAARQIDQT